MTAIRAFAAASLALALGLTYAAFSDLTGTDPRDVPAVPAYAGGNPLVDRESGRQTDGTYLEYGKPHRLGNGTVRTYVVLDRKENGRPLEIGVAMSEQSMEGLPQPGAMPIGEGKMDHSAHVSMVMYLLDLPDRNPTPYTFVQFDWNPAGHEPPGVYDLAHFDFHFYTVSDSVRSSIVPSDPDYARKAGSYPAPEFRPAFYTDAATPAGAPPAAVAVPGMGMHWLDVRSPELQGMAGNPSAFKPFTKTFIYGSWDGRFIFDEPMITRAYIMAKKEATDPAVFDEIVPVPRGKHHTSAGYYANAYRIKWDYRAREYRIALTQLAWRE